MNSKANCLRRLAADEREEGRTEAGEGERRGNAWRERGKKGETGAEREA